MRSIQRIKQLLSQTLHQSPPLLQNKRLTHPASQTSTQMHTLNRQLNLRLLQHEQTLPGQIQSQRRNRT